MGRTVKCCDMGVYDTTEHPLIDETPESAGLHPDSNLHLGNVVIDCELSDVADYNSKKGNFIASVNWFVRHFSGQVPLDCYLRLFQTYCSSHYGSVLWELNGKALSSFCIS